MRGQKSVWLALAQGKLESLQRDNIGRPSCFTTRLGDADVKKPGCRASRFFMQR